MTQTGFAPKSDFQPRHPWPGTDPRPRSRHSPRHGRPAGPVYRPAPRPGDRVLRHPAPAQGAPGRLVPITRTVALLTAMLLLTPVLPALLG
ncbi:hypothetical protein [Pseudoponticoccus marisrubri]|uniref:Uncharacterized protein n=1 Tax=Pseudoponticoccus marisrubri TaxID=1685382 RepID=A0A0W7WDV5_9RHOB|nr:hypothetical protein [Pseudoponticoccus marisrubri]KUF08828.1 hypothetical protein AVJ23_20730 [Pseudoponticoccus marisrubri]